MLTANSLKNGDVLKKLIEKEVKIILYSIDDKLRIAYQQGTNHEIKVSLPITFGIPNMQNKDAQRAVYYRIITSLVERDFQVKIEIKPDKTYIYISWLSDDEKDEIDIQNKVLAEHTIEKVVQ